MKKQYVIYILLAILLLAIFFSINYNRVISLEEQISSAESDIIVQEKRRADLIPNLVDSVKAYDQYEYETLIDIVSARNFGSDADIDEITNKIQVIAEAYPELKSNENYRELMNELSITENLIANYRSNYNKWVKSYKQYVRKFPTHQILNICGYDIVDYEYLNFDVSSDAPTNLFK